MDQIILSREQVRNCDKIAVKKYKMPSIVLMENAGKAAAQLIHQRLENTQAKVLILAGPGNNGGDGFVVARHLFNEGVPVEVVILVAQEKIRDDARVNFDIIEAMGFPLFFLNSLSDEPATKQLMAKINDADVLVDAMLGTGVTGPPREPIRMAIEAINTNREGKTIISLDIPSGLDCNTGEALECAIKADFTVTFAAIKQGFSALQACEFTGKVSVATIGIATRLLI